jgi:hypothetical protein
MDVKDGEAGRAAARQDRGVRTLRGKGGSDFALPQTRTRPAGDGGGPRSLTNLGCRDQVAGTGVYDRPARGYNRREAWEQQEWP